MTLKKKALALILALGLAGLIAAGVAGIRYYHDNIKPPALAPRQVIEQYFEAIKRRDYQKAYSFVCLRHFRNSFNQFRDRVDTYSPDMTLEFTGETIDKNTAVVDLEVSVPMGFGLYKADGRMYLVRVKRDWKIITP